MMAVVIPQAFRAVIPPLMNEFIALIKDTALVFIIVGVTVATRDIYTAAQAFASESFSPTPFIGASIGYLIITIPLTRLVGYAERRLRAGLV
jgi:ABC-type amino acid transport system permease subunit